MKLGSLDRTETYAIIIESNHTNLSAIESVYKDHLRDIDLTTAYPGDSGLSPGAKFGIGIGSMVAICFVGACGMICLRSSNIDCDDSCCAACCVGAFREIPVGILRSL